MDLDSPVNIIGTNVGRVELSALFGGGRLRLRDNENEVIAELVAALNAAALALGGAGYDGSIRIKDAAGTAVITLSGRDQDLTVFNSDGDQTIRLDGASGDIKLTGGDAAEDFELADGAVPPGCVMVISDDGKLAASREPYDRRVAGVISGAGNLRPGIVLGTGSSGNAQPIALAGTVCCQVDATDDPIEVGDLLTTSTTRGHAMRATHDRAALGAVLGKALGPLPRGKGLVPILVALQ